MDKKDIKKLLVIIVGFVLCSSFLFPREYFFSFWESRMLYVKMVCIISTIIFVWKFKNKRDFQFKIPSFFFLALLGIIYILLSGYNHIGRIVDSSGFIMLLIALLFLLISHNFKNYISVIRSKICFLLLCFALLQEGIIALQILGYVDNYFKQFQFGGTLGNPNLISIYMTPVLVYSFGIIIFRKESYGYRIFACLVLLIGISQIVYATCRTACLSFVISSLYLIIIRLSDLKNRKQKRIFYLLFLLILFLVTLYLPQVYYFREESIKGRFFVWILSLNLLKENSLFGCGFGNFEMSLFNEQIKYFSSVELSDYYYNAGSLTKGFNDLLQFTCEIGLLGIFFFLIALYLFFRDNYFNYSLKQNKRVDRILFASFLSLFICSQFYFVFSVVPIAIIGLLFLVLLSSCNNNRTGILVKISRVRYIFLVLIAICFYSFIFSYKTADTYLFLSRLENSNLSLIRETELNKLTQIIDQSHTDSKIYYFSGNIFQKKQKNQLALKAYEKGYRQSSSYLLALKLAEQYVKCGEIDKAKKILYRTQKQIPYLLRPKYFLFKIYLKQGEIDKAIKIGNEIMLTQPKIENEYSSEIKRVTANHLQKLKFHEKN